MLNKEKALENLESNRRMTIDVLTGLIASLSPDSDSDPTELDYKLKIMIQDLKETISGLDQAIGRLTSTAK